MMGAGKHTFSPHMAINRGMIVTILHMLNGSEETAQSTFMDVVPDAYYAKAVAWVQRNGIVAGYGNGMFGPEDSLTREQLATLLCNMQVYLSPTSQSLLFSRIPEKYPLMPLMPWPGRMIITVKGNGILDHIGTATRAETARILERLAEQEESMK